MRAVPQRKRYLFVCVNRRPEGNPKGSCAQRHSVEIHAALKAELGKRGLAATEAREHPSFTSSASTSSSSYR